LRPIRRYIFGRRSLQPLFTALYKVSLAGMNVGEGGDPRFSGEVAVLSLLKKRFQATARPVIFDVGANVGTYTAEILKVFGTSVQIWAFEPSSAGFEQLRERFASIAEVHPVNLAFGQEVGTQSLQSPSRGSKLASFYARPLDRTESFAVETEDVAVTTIDKFCSDKAITAIDFLKLDTEGHDLRVLEGARSMIDDGTVSAIQFEFGSPYVYSRTFVRDFYEMLEERYRLFRILRDGLLPLPAYEERLEIFWRATNYLALRR
jgi:FkbM family methyltransferase